jgi:hypothetical protein
MKTLALTAAVAIALAVGGCSDNTTSGQAAASHAPPPSPATTSAAPTLTTCATGDCAGGPSSAPPVLAGDPAAPVVCPKILQAQGTDAVYNDPAAMQAIGEQAATSPNAELSQAGKLLTDRAKLAKAAKGKGDESATMLGMGTAAAQLATVCAKAGFKK